MPPSLIRSTKNTNKSQSILLAHSAAGAAVTVKVLSYYQGNYNSPKLFYCVATKSSAALLCGMCLTPIRG